MCRPRSAHQAGVAARPAHPPAQPPAAHERRRARAQRPHRPTPRHVAGEHPRRRRRRRRPAPRPAQEGGGAAARPVDGGRHRRLLDVRAARDARRPRLCLRHGHRAPRHLGHPRGGRLVSDRVNLRRRRRGRGRLRARVGRRLRGPTARAAGHAAPRPRGGGRRRRAAGVCRLLVGARRRRRRRVLDGQLRGGGGGPQGGVARRRCAPRDGGAVLLVGRPPPRARRGRGRQLPQGARARARGHQASWAWRASCARSPSGAS